MEPTVTSLSRELLAKLQNLEDGQRILVGLCGIPASGKSSLAQALAAKCNELYGSAGSPEVALVVGLDGWHLPRKTLAMLPNAEEAFARRGAHWTFDGIGYVEFVQKLRSSTVTPATNSDNRGEAVVPKAIKLSAPTFSHSTKDPIMDDLVVQSHHRIVILEGLYVFLGIEPWRTAAELLDERWLVEVNLQDARRRIVARHVRTGVTETEEEAIQRAEQNDFPNGEFVVENMLKPTCRLRSIEDPSIAI